VTATFGNHSLTGFSPLIELVKTPGRRKVLSKKPKLGSKLGSAILFPLVRRLTVADPSH
jgi:hypothetical protein